MSSNKYDPAVEDRLKALQTRLDSGVFRSAGMEKMESTISEMQDGLDRLLATVDWDNLKCESIADIYKLGITVSGLSRARTESEKLKADFEGQYTRAYQDMDFELSKVLEKNPTLQAELTEHLRKVYSKKIKKVVKSKSGDKLKG